MRHWLLILMIALLPVRGWIGDAMATQMASGQHQQTATESIAAHAHEMGAQAHFDHEVSVSETASAPETAQTVPDCAGHASGESAHAADSHCDSCSACQACHTVALSPTAPGFSAVFHAFTLPRAVADQFASAEAALRQKPPIS